MDGPKETMMVALPLQRFTTNHEISGPVHLAWFGAGAVIAFLFPFLLSSVLDLPNDLYYAIYFTGALTLLFLYVRVTRIDLLGFFSRNWRASMVLGILAALFLVVGVLQREDSTPRPEGLYFIFTIAWRGIVYGVVDALVLTAFPVAVALGLFASRLDSLARKAGFAAVALLLSLTITATYHLGYDQFREDGIAGPETGNAIISLPAVLTANPVGSVLAHASMHVAANIHAYETELYLPPKTTVND